MYKIPTVDTSSLESVIEDEKNCSRLYSAFVWAHSNNGGLYWELRARRKETLSDSDHFYLYLCYCSNKITQRHGNMAVSLTDGAKSCIEKMLKNHEFK